MLDLLSLPGKYLDTYGRDKVAEVVGENARIVAMWQARGKFPLAAVHKLLLFDPAPLSAIAPLQTTPEPGKKVAFLVPLSGPPQAKTMDNILKLYDRTTMDYKRVAFNNLSVSRNALAAWALRGPFEWFWWHDGDSVVPCGDAAWFKTAADLPHLPDEYARLNSIHRALYHKKTIVSVCYVGRAKGAAPQFGGGNTPVNRALVKRGPRNELIERPWAGMGGMLTHRSVFEDIIKVMGDEIRVKPDSPIRQKWNYEYAFFHPLDLETNGDDVPMCARALRSGHKTYVDLALQAGHVGDHCYSFQDL